MTAQWMNMLSVHLNNYKFLTDSYVIEFFSEDHWSKLPLSWQKCLEHASLDEFVCQMYGMNCPPLEHQSDSFPRTVLPLSLLSFGAVSHTLSFNRAPPHPVPPPQPVQVSNIDHLFRRHVKPKKQHELIQLGNIIQRMCRDTNCYNVIDIGCGQGHLARYLAFEYGLNVIAVEAVDSHVQTAAQYDMEVITDIEKAITRGEQKARGGCVHYINGKVISDTSLESFVSLINGNFDVINHKLCYVLVGLHACGDLSATILKLFKSSDMFVGLVSVGCCYMKLTEIMAGASHGSCGYPLSHALSSSPSHNLSYQAKELACHAMETYINRLMDGSFDHLKTHCYRNGLRRSHVKISKSTSKLPFKNYVNAVLASVNIVASEDEIQYMESHLITKWKLVVFYFLLRLTLAPCIETVILLDRMMYIHEQQDMSVNLFPLFNPFVSPRNIVLTANKNSSFIIQTL